MFSLSKVAIVYRPFLLLTVLYLLTTAAQAPPYPPVNADVQRPPFVRYPFRLEVVDQPARPVIDQGHPDCAANRSGFEGGYVVKQAGVYHLFVGEMTGTPHRARMQIALWTSPDATNWQRQKTIIAGAEARTVADNQSEVWMQQALFNETENRWNLLYIAYRAGDATQGQVPDLDHNGVVGRLRSTVPGLDGIGADYEKVDVVFEPNRESLPWEGQQGTDSFFAYQVGRKWYGIYGSRNHVPPGPWLVGLAEAKQVQGPYKRLKSHSPLPIERFFVENPMVLRVDGLGWVCVYEVGGYAYANYPYKEANTVGYAYSANGRDWLPGKPLKVQPEAEWSADMRTPFGLVPEGNDEYTLLYSAREKDKPFWSIGRARVRLVRE